MSILGVVVRTRPSDLPAVEQALRALPGVELAERTDAADGRIVLVIEDNAGRAASATMAEIALWPHVLNASLVYEYSDIDADGKSQAVAQYTDWRSSLADLGRKRDPEN